MVEIIAITNDACASCISLKVILTSLVQNYKDVYLTYYDKDLNTLIRKYNIERLPVIIVSNNKREIARCYGNQNEEILNIWLEDKIIEAKKEDK